MSSYKQHDFEHGTEEQAQDLASMLRTCGKMIGFRTIGGFRYEFYVLDGHVYFIVRGQAYYRDEYFKFCHDLRNNHYRDFVRRSNFHLGKDGDGK